MKLDRITKNPFLLFFPIHYYLYFYILTVRSDFSGDTIRYLRFADHLLHGYYSPPARIWTLLMVRVIRYACSLSCCKSTFDPDCVIECSIYYLSIILLFKALRKTVKEGVALTFSLFWACYYIAFQGLNSILTETLLIC